MRKLLLIALTVILSNVHFATAAQDLNEKNANDKTDFSFAGNGYFVSTPVDINQDGVLASHMKLRGKSKQLGNASINVIADTKVELDANGIPKSCVTPDGDQGISVALVKALGIVQLKGGDQLFTEATSMSLCLSISKCLDEEGKAKEGCTFKPAVTAKVIGGTGKFACASGHTTDDHIRTVLAIDPRGEPFGSASEYKIHGTVHIPSNCDK